MFQPGINDQLRNTAVVLKWCDAARASGVLLVHFFDAFLFPKENI